jgi:hypothetical protein
MRALGFHRLAPLLASRLAPLLASRLAPLLVFLLVSGVLWPGGGWAAPQESDQKSDTGGAISIQAENDLFGGGTDRHFTNGVRLSFFYPAKRLPRVARALGAVLPFLPVSRSSRFMLALGQNIYTPDDISATALIPDDRPYAGWLFSELGIVAPAGHHVDSFVVSLGVIGPASLGGAVQRFWHAHVINAPRPQGWQNQLRNEPAVMLLYQREWRHLRLLGNSGLRVDFTPRIGGALGNVFTYLSAGGIARLGYNLSKHDSGPPRIRPSLPGSGFFTRPPHGIGGYLFAGGEVRAVARNIFLDGNTFRRSHSVPKKHLVADFQAGLALTVSVFGAPSRLSYTFIYRTKEFDGQNGADKFGSISLGVAF